MVRNLIIALCATIIFSCEKNESLQEIENFYKEPTMALGILEQLQKDVKNSNSTTGKSNDLYITSCIDDRLDIVISGPVSNPSSFINGSERLDLDFFTFDNKSYVLIRSEENLPYGLPDSYNRLHYIKESSNDLGVYLSSGKQTSITGDWDFLFQSEDLRFLYELDSNYNVIGGSKPLSTVNIQCDAYEGWYAANSAEINWDQGTYGEYVINDKPVDSVFIRLNQFGEFIAGGYTRPDDFFLENYFSESINTNIQNGVWSPVPVEGKTLQSQYGTYDNGDGVTQYYYGNLVDQYELRGYQLRSNGSSTRFVWWPYGLNEVQYIGEMDLIKINKAPSQDLLNQAKIDYESLTFIERNGNWFELDETKNKYNYGGVTFDLPKYVYATETEVSGYSLTDILLSSYSEISFTNRNIVDNHSSNNNRYKYYYLNNGGCTERVRFYAENNINDPEYRVTFYKYEKDEEDNCTYNDTIGFYSYGTYKAISNPNIIIN